MVKALVALWIEPNLVISVDVYFLRPNGARPSADTVIFEKRFRLNSFGYWLSRISFVDDDIIQNAREKKQSQATWTKLYFVDYFGFAFVI